MIRVHESFTSLSGEPDGFNRQGYIAKFIRLQGCNLQCTWCDTKDSVRSIGCCKSYTVEQLMDKCCECEYIIITGGEPLLQWEALEPLVQKLIQAKHKVTIETNGSRLLPELESKNLRYVVDYKLVSSSMSLYMKPAVFRSLRPIDVIKFVISDLEDYRHACQICATFPNWEGQKVFSPVSADKNWAKQLANLMFQDNLQEIKLSLQLHKQINLQ